ncbi:hypothetical protein SLA2020_442720 [Shorea laevis]
MLSSNGDHGGHYPSTPQTPTTTNHSCNFELHDPMHHVDAASPQPVTLHHIEAPPAKNKLHVEAPQPQLSLHHHHHGEVQPPCLPKSIRDATLMQKQRSAPPTTQSQIQSPKLRHVPLFAQRSPVEEENKTPDERPPRKRLNSDKTAWLVKLIPNLLLVFLLHFLF